LKLEWENRLSKEARDRVEVNRKWRDQILQNHKQKLEEARTAATAAAAREMEGLRKDLEQSRVEVESLSKQARDQTEADRSWREETLARHKIMLEEARSGVAATAADAACASLAVSTTATTTNPKTSKQHRSPISVQLENELNNAKKEASKLQENFNKIAMQNFKHSDTIEELRNNIYQLKDRLKDALGRAVMPLKIED